MENVKWETDEARFKGWRFAALAFSWPSLWNPQICGFVGVAVKGKMKLVVVGESPKAVYDELTAMIETHGSRSKA